MSSILNPTINITLADGTPTSLIVPSGESHRGQLATVRLACDVSFDRGIGALEGYQLGFELHADDSGDRQLLAPFAWGEINPNGDLLLQQRVRFHSETPAGTRAVERVAWVDQHVLDEDGAEPRVTPWGILNIRAEDEIVAVFTLTYFRWPDIARGMVRDTAEAKATVRL